MNIYQILDNTVARLHDLLYRPDILITHVTVHRF